ncbi:MAG: ZIP family metal transporter [Coprococcus sp.]
MNGILMALFGTLGTFLITALGAAGIFFVRREVSGNLQCGFLGFAGGVMIAASVWSLLLPGIDFAEANGQVGWLVMTGGFLLGVITLLVADGLMKAWYEREKSTQLTLGKSTAMLIIAITTHNIPEGMSVGLAFALAGQNNARYGYVVARCVAGCTGDRSGIQNFPRRDRQLHCRSS